MEIPKLIICNNEIKLSESIKFLGVFLDESLTWKHPHTKKKYTENKIVRNLGLLFRSKPYLTKKCLLSVYYSYIHTYISSSGVLVEYLCIKLKKINNQQKYAIRMKCNKKSMKQYWNY